MALQRLLHLAGLVQHRLRQLASRPGEGGFSTAEMLGLAALGVAAAALIWGLLTGVADDIVNYIRDTATGGVSSGGGSGG